MTGIGARSVLVIAVRLNHTLEARCVRRDGSSGLGPSRTGAPDDGGGGVSSSTKLSLTRPTGAPPPCAVTLGLLTRGSIAQHQLCLKSEEREEQLINATVNYETIDGSSGLGPRMTESWECKSKCKTKPHPLRRPG